MRYSIAKIYSFNSTDGRMKIGFNSNDDLLPVEFEMGTNGCFTKGGCSLVGDIRGDENIPLHTMHTLWVREHNRIAEMLKPLNPLWTDELLYKTARKINGALWQHIVYNEYIPLLANLPDYIGYNDTVDPSIFNGFSTAAFRYGHSLVPNEFLRLNNGFNSANDTIVLQNAFFNREIVNERGIEPIMFGLVGNTSNNVDDGFAHSIARKLFVAVGSDDFLDLTALNIQRGRDHGLPGYNAYRKSCGLTEATWENLNNIMITGVAAKFQAIYQSPDDIDVFAGGISEKHIDNLEVGETFNCILSQQFEALRDGDRFYYENPGLFSEAQLRSIKNVTMSTILCNNLKGIVSIQPDAFRTPEYKYNNRRIVCHSIPKLDLTPWKETSLSYDEEDLYDDTKNVGNTENDFQVFDGNDAGVIHERSETKNLDENVNSRYAKGFYVSDKNDVEENRNLFGSNVEKQTENVGDMKEKSSSQNNDESLPDETVNSKYAKGFNVSDKNDAEESHNNPSESNVEKETENVGDMTKLSSSQGKGEILPDETVISKATKRYYAVADENKASVNDKFESGKTPNQNDEENVNPFESIVVKQNEHEIGEDAINYHLNSKTQQSGYPRKQDLANVDKESYPSDRQETSSSHEKEESLPVEVINSKDTKEHNYHDVSHETPKSNFVKQTAGNEDEISHDLSNTHHPQSSGKLDEVSTSNGRNMYPENDYQREAEGLRVEFEKDSQK